MTVPFLTLKQYFGPICKFENTLVQGQLWLMSAEGLGAALVATPDCLHISILFIVVGDQSNTIETISPVAVDSTSAVMISAGIIGQKKCGQQPKD